jgi:hypothetical protein
MRKQPGYAILLGSTILLAVLATLTAVPVAESRSNLFGYPSLCSWMPWSTLLLVALSAVSCKVRSRWFVQRNARR